VSRRQILAMIEALDDLADGQDDDLGQFLGTVAKQLNAFCQPKAIMSNSCALYVNNELVGIITNPDPVVGGANGILEALNATDETAKLVPVLFPSASLIGGAIDVAGVADALEPIYDVDHDMEATGSLVPDIREKLGFVQNLMVIDDESATYESEEGTWYLYRSGNGDKQSIGIYLDGIVTPSKVLRVESGDWNVAVADIVDWEALPFDGACCSQAVVENCVCRLSFSCPVHTNGQRRCHGSHD